MGPIEVEWKATAEAFQMTVELPPGVPGRIRLPQDWGDKVVLDDAPVAAGSEDGAPKLEVTPGRHVITIGR